MEHWYGNHIQTLNRLCSFGDTWNNQLMYSFMKTYQAMGVEHIIHIHTLLWNTDMGTISRLSIGYAALGTLETTSLCIVSWRPTKLWVLNTLFTSTHCYGTLIWEPYPHNADDWRNVERSLVIMIAYAMRSLISVLNEIAVAKLGAPPIVKRRFFKLICIPRLGTHQRNWTQLLVSTCE